MAADVYGVSMLDMDELGETGFTPFEAVVILKGFHPDGTLGLMVVSSDGIPQWELLGMAEVLKQDAVTYAVLSSGDDDDDTEW